MPEITIDLFDRSYRVLVGRGVLGEPASYADALGTRSLIVTSETVASLHLDALRTALGPHPHGTHIVPDGDAAKTLDQLERILDAAVEARLARDATIVALGGGAVGDVAGLAAALYHRGIGVIQVPTTLLAQVDSSVGGKTAVNHRAGKNLIGAFHQPRRVVADVATLATLPPRELRAGFAEVVKYALLDGLGFFEWLEAHAEALVAGDATALEQVVSRCCAIKARFVAADETERGSRALLNLGHTFGHALENAYEGALLHGEAVALGCVMAARMSQSLGWLPGDAAPRTIALLRALGLPVALPTPAPSADALVERMGRDKKVAEGVVRLVLLHGIGDAVLTADYPRAALELTVRDFVSGKLPG